MDHRYSERNTTTTTVMPEMLRCHGCEALAIMDGKFICCHNGYGIEEGPNKFNPRGECEQRDFSGVTKVDD